MAETYRLDAVQAWNRQAWYHPLQRPAARIYLPLVVKASD